jgi:hypothetical protein
MAEGRQVRYLSHINTIKTNLIKSVPVWRTTDPQKPIKCPEMAEYKFVNQLSG